MDRIPTGQAPATLTVTLTLAKETTNTRVYKADPMSGPAPVDTLYVAKWAAAQLGSPATIELTISAK